MRDLYILHIFCIVSAYLWTLLWNYLEADQMDRMCGEGIHLFDQSNFDMDRGGLVTAEGRPAGPGFRGKSQRTRDVLCRILDPETDPESALCLVAEMVPTRVGLALKALTTFHAGLNGKANP
jgi:hypothetical protein